jgi:hypothetical protein
MLRRLMYAAVRLGRDPRTIVEADAHFCLKASGDEARCCVRASADPASLVQGAGGARDRL